VGYDVTTNRLLHVTHAHSIYLGYNLVGDQNSYSKLIGDPLQGSQKLSQVHLTG